MWRGRPRPRNASRAQNRAARPTAFRFSLSTALIAALLLAARSSAQKLSGPAFHGPAGNFSQRAGAHPFGSRRSSRSPLAALPFPFLGDSFNPDDFAGDTPSSADPSSVPPFLMQALQSLGGPGAASLGGNAGGKNRAPSSSEPLMIELQNGRYVRVKSSAIDAEAQPLPVAATKESQSTKSSRDRTGKTPAIPPATAVASAPLPAAVLIFRDGHSEEVRDYTIANGALYAQGDYYTDGYWNKKIELASLNIPGTLDANAQRNVKFPLPSSPNEVITRF